MAGSRRDVARLAGSRHLRGAGLSLAGRGRLSSRNELLRLFMPTTAGALPPPRLASEAEILGIPAFGRATSLIAGAIASTDWFAERQDPVNRVWTRLPDQPAFLTDPYPNVTPWTYRWALAEDGILFGNAFGLLGDLDWRTGRPGWVYPLAADEVWYLTDPARPGWWQWAVDGVTLDADELLHIPFGARSGELLGRGVLEQYGGWFGGVVSAEEYSRDTFAAGALPPAVLTSKAVTNEATAGELKRLWRELTSNREPVVLPDGTTLTPVVGNAQQQQLIEARTWNAAMVANVVGVPGWKLGLDQTTQTYQNITDADVDFVRDSVDRWALPISAVVTKFLMPAGTRVSWDYSSRQRADSKTTAEVLIDYLIAGVLTIDEVRAAIGRAPLGSPLTPAEPDAEATVDPDAIASAAAAASTIAMPVAGGGRS